MELKKFLDECLEISRADFEKQRRSSNRRQERNQYFLAPFAFECFCQNWFWIPKFPLINRNKLELSLDLDEFSDFYEDSCERL